jgi:hypothetical protein
VLSSALHRDDFAKRGLAGSGQTTLPFEVDGADILLLDDVLYTGRTMRAVLNELFDYGRPGARAAGGAGRPRRARAAGGGRVRRRALCCPPPSRWRWRARATAGSAFASRHGAEHAAAQPPTQPARRADPPAVHRGPGREMLTHILDTAAQFVSVNDREVKKVPLLRGKSVFNLFFENSTRTRTTFEIAAKRLSADVSTWTSRARPPPRASRCWTPWPT